jgi:hypothetical protein
VHRVDEELRSTTVGLAGVGHGQGAGLVGQTRAASLAELIRDGAVGSAGDLALAWIVVLSSGGGTTGPGGVGRGVLHHTNHLLLVKNKYFDRTTVTYARMRASKLIHEIRDDSVEVQTIVKALVGKINEVVRSDGHLLSEQLNGEGAHGGVNNSVLRHFLGCGRTKRTTQGIIKRAKNFS